jgi:hypothetical protein
MDNYGQTALYLAAMKEDEAVVRLPLEYKADVSTKDRFGRTACTRRLEKGARPWCGCCWSTGRMST